ncbi:MAG TPA: translation initiation factor IF-2 [Desulfobacteraceae bacterium]|nr:translation initiation factor IF-2 [Desulfobacteraceae bacterium]
MAKVRVYELAKELDMGSKELVEKLVARGMNIKNYMSTLDEQAVLEAKEIVSGVISEVVEEKRVKSTVIRRRRKKIRIDKEVTPEETENKIEIAIQKAKEIEEKPVAKGTPKAELPIEEKETDHEKISEIEPPLEKPEAKASDEKAGKPAVEPKAKPKKTKKNKSYHPAKIIKRPEEGHLKDVLVKQIKKKPAPSLTKSPVSKTSLKTETEKVEALATPKSVKKKRDRRKKETKESLAKRPVRRIKREVYEKADLYQSRSAKYRGKRGGKKVKESAKKAKKTEITVPKAIKRRIKIQEFVTVAELAKAMGTKATELIKRLMDLGYMANINKSLDFETASVVADEIGYKLELDTFKEEHLISEPEDRSDDLKPRPPVVTIMGHVDHGKTSLLDYIRESNIIGGESGGITQHIGAYYVKTEEGDVVFLDTPGHEAFTAMRARGAKVTDLIVLVVAADDGVMPQTREAINHARAADIPIVVAINKIDKPEANPDKVIRELAELELTPEDWGGETIFGHISAKTGEGIDELLGLILLQSEILELKGNPKKAARGTVIEAKLDKSKGSAATVLVKNGTLKRGDYFICGDRFGKVRAMLDHRGKEMLSAGPSMPVEIYGISGVPMAGDEFIVVKDEKTAKQVIVHRKGKRQDIPKRDIISLDDLFERMKEGEVKELNIVLKADVQGSLEALSDSLVKQSTKEVKLNIIHSATGAITESDIMLASASNAIVLGFNIRANPRVSEIAEKENIDIRYYNVIYNAINDVRMAMAGLLEPIYEEHVIGRAEIKEIFHVPKVGSVAGCLVTDGHIERNFKIRLLRDDVIVFDGKIASLRRFKEDVKEVQSGYECGVGLENYNDIKPGDIFEVYRVEEIEAEL